MTRPLVTVICLCYNHEQFVAEAISSVLSQTFPNIQLIVVDDASTDGSVSVIRKSLTGLPGIEFLALQENLGNCRAFNRGFALAKGEFVIDLAADDVLMPTRVEKGVQAFNSGGERMGVNFTDTELIDARGTRLGFHSDRFPHADVPQGDIYRDLLTRYFINSPTMMIRSEVLKQLGGYDESLAYEDFDFWIRSSRLFEYCYTPEALVRRRVVSDSLGKSQYRRKSPQLTSTLRVCEKAFHLNRDAGDRLALKKRVLYELRRAFFLGEFRLTRRYMNLWRKLS